MTGTYDTTGTANGLDADTDRRCAAVTDDVIAWRRHVHQHPELSNREVDTAGYIADHLGTLRLDEVRTGIAGHGVVGVLRGTGTGTAERVIALRADFDALPVKEATGDPFASTVVDENYPGGPFPVAHACGHDCHTAMLMGAATVLAGMRERFAGTVLFVFQPAEEGAPLGEYAGAQAMDDAGALADPRPTMAFGMHVGPLPTGYVGYRVGNQFGASCVVKIDLTGKQVHGSTPWMGVDPMPAAADIVSATGQLYRQMNAFDAFTVTIGHIQDTGRFNIVGGELTMLGTIRCAVESDMRGIQEKLTRTANGIAAAYGCQAAVAYEQDVPAVHNTREWVEAALPVLRAVAGEAKVVETPATLGYDDVSVFVNKYGGLYVMLGVQDAEFADGGLRPVAGGRGVVMNHNPAFYANEEGLPVGVRLHVRMALAHLAGTVDAERR